MRVTGSASAASTNDGTTWFLDPELSRNDRYQPAPLAYPSAHCGRQHRSNRDPKPGFSVHDPPRNGRQLRGLGRWKHLPPVELRLELRHARNRRRLRSGSRRARLGGNSVGYANSATADAIGAEINFGALTSGGTATGILLASAGGFQTNGAFIQMKANNATAKNSWGIGVANSSGNQPLLSTGAILATDGSIQCPSGIDFGSATFSVAAIILPPGGNIALNSTTGTKIGTSQNQKLGFWNVTPVVRPSAFTLTYTTGDKTLGAYAPNVQGTAYVGLNNTQSGTPYAALADLNALRLAYENLRAFTEDGVQALVAAIKDLQSVGLLRRASALPARNLKTRSISRNGSAQTTSTTTDDSLVSSAPAKICNATSLRWRERGRCGLNT